jgi:hypothetical protein
LETARQITDREDVPVLLIDQKRRLAEVHGPDTVEQDLCLPFFEFGQVVILPIRRKWEAGMNSLLFECVFPRMIVFEGRAVADPIDVLCDALGAFLAASIWSLTYGDSAAIRRPSNFS